MEAFLTESCCNLARSDRMEQLEGGRISESLKPDTAWVRAAWFYLCRKWIAEKNASSKSCRLTPGARLLEKLTVLRWLDSSHFLNPDGSLSSSQDSGEWPISCASSIQSTPSHPVSLRSTLILVFLLRLGLQNCLFPAGFLIETLSVCCSPPPIRATCSTLHPPFDLGWSNGVPGKQYKSRSSLCNFLQSPHTSSLSIQFSITLSQCPSHHMTRILTNVTQPAKW